MWQFRTSISMACSNEGAKQRKEGQVLQSHFSLLNLLKTATGGRIVHAQMVGNLREAIAILSIRVVNQARLRLPSLKEHAQGRSAGLRLPPRNIPGKIKGTGSRF